MKKAILLTAGAVLMLSMSSCFKFRSCVCTTTDTATGAFVSSNTITTISHGKKAAEAECSGYESADAFQTVSCELE